MTNHDARSAAVKNANQFGITMVWGWQTNDVTGLNEYGYCPQSAVGRAFVHTVIEVIEPTPQAAACFLSRSRSNV